VRGKEEPIAVFTLGNADADPDAGGDEPAPKEKDPSTTTPKG